MLGRWLALFALSSSLLACANGGRRPATDGGVTTDSSITVDSNVPADGSVPDGAPRDTGTPDSGVTDSGRPDTIVPSDGGDCSGGLTLCAGACVNLDSDDVNCGACERACATGEACMTGVCTSVCPMGAIDCSGTCVDPLTDDMNCGGCGAACGTGEACTAGACTPICAMGETACSGVCVDTSADDMNCGACGVVCGTGTSCTSGTCVMVPTTTTVTFPSSSDTRVASAGLYFWRMGDYVEGTRTTTLPSLTSVSFALTLDSNGLTCDTQDVSLSINGVTVGSFSIASGTMSVMQSFTFAAITGPSYTIRLETTRTVASGCGSAGYANDVTIFTLGG